MRKLSLILAGALLCSVASAAHAGWTVMPSGQAKAVAKSSLTITPRSDWNSWSRRPSVKGEIWTLDGASLNELSFYAGISTGEALFKERNKKDKPLPKFRSNMLSTDIADMFEQSMRILLDTSLFKINVIEPAKLAGHDGVRFTYHYTVQADEVRRIGETRAAIINGKLYLINFAAPAIHYFDRDIEEVRAMMDSASL